MRYEGANFVLGNRSEDETINIAGLAFDLYVPATEEGLSTEEGVFIVARSFALRGSDFSQNAFTLRPNRCLQILDSGLYRNPPPQNMLARGLCDERFQPFWITWPSVFWSSEVAGAYFEVRRGSEILGRCPANERLAFDEMRCAVPAQPTPEAQPDASGS